LACLPLRATRAAYVSIGRPRLNWSCPRAGGLGEPSPGIASPIPSAPPVDRPAPVGWRGGACRGGARRAPPRPRRARSPPPRRRHGRGAWRGGGRPAPLVCPNPPPFPLPLTRWREPLAFHTGRRRRRARAACATGAPQGRRCVAALPPAVCGTRAWDPAGGWRRPPRAAATTARRRDNAASHPPRAHTLAAAGIGAGLGTWDCRAVVCLASAHVGPRATQRTYTS